MGALFHDSLLAQHKDTVVVLDGGQTVGDGQCGAAMSQLFKALSHKDFALVIQCAGGFVQNQDGRVLQENPGNGDALLLSAGQLDTALANIGVVAVLQRKDELFRARQTGGGLGGTLLQVLFLALQGFGLAVQGILLLVKEVYLTADPRTAQIDFLVGL